jgi:ribosomal protein S18 acetylase RimI-like enzyme
VTFAVRRGLPDGLRDAAARLYWQAFGPKLGRVLGPEARALAFLDRTIRADHCLCAVTPDGGLLGLAGFKTPQGAFAGGGFPDLAAVYGPAGAAWRASVLWALSREVDNDRFLMDGLCVDPAARGAGVGTALIEALCAEGRARHYTALRLDVIDTNLRARALYERLGFTATRTVPMGPLGLIFGFQAATTMVRPLA